MGATTVNLYETRRLRRKALDSLIRDLTNIMEAETAYMERMPENLQGSLAYETAENAVSVFEEALDILQGAYS